MLGLEPRIYGIASDCSTNWATTTAQLSYILQWDAAAGKLHFNLNDFGSPQSYFLFALKDV